MDKEKTGFCTGYLICNQGLAAAASLSAMHDGEVSHDQITRHLSAGLCTSKDLWADVKPAVRQAEGMTLA